MTLTDELIAKAQEAEAIRLFKDRWPAKSWTGIDVNRAYWRRRAAQSRLADVIAERDEARADTDHAPPPHAPTREEIAGWILAAWQTGYEDMRCDAAYTVADRILALFPPSSQGEAK